jgi:hypothetical protein
VAKALFVAAAVAFLLLIFRLHDTTLKLVLLAIDVVVLALLAPFMLPPFDGRFRLRRSRE